MSRFETLVAVYTLVWLVLCWTFSRRFRQQLDADRWPDV